ncbi:MAG: NUDIX domain-containing protein [Oscillospiraceae bacterium]|nr:NUDIX domain-containing protein [Oscillospiraceae bacterium]
MGIECVVVAFLKHEGQYLLIKRSPDKKHFPNVWDGVGGGVEKDEFQTPDKAILREIYEETGLKRNDVSGLTLRYVHVKRIDDFLCYHYVYFGEASKNDVWQTDEGVLYWVSEKELFERTYSPTMEQLLRHYFSSGRNTPDLYLFSTYQGVDTITPFETENY